MSRHRLFAGTLFAGFLVRQFAVLGYAPALWFNDSFEYVGIARRPEPHVIRPNGYSFFVAALEPFHSFRLVTVVQHVLGLTVGVLVYVLLRRYGFPSWVATAAAAPQILDGNQIQLEHMILSETLFTFSLACAVFALCWRPRISVGMATAAGALLAVASLTRTIGLPLAAIVGLWIVFQKPGWRPFIAFSVTLLIPLACYAGWYQSVHGQFRISGSDGIFLYARTTTFVDCERVSPPAHLRILCPTEPLDARHPPAHYIWHVNSPLWRVPGPTFDKSKESLAREFAWHAIATQPLDYLSAATRDFLRTFGPRSGSYPYSGVAERYNFDSPPLVIPHEVRIAGGTVDGDLWWYEQGPVQTRQWQPAAYGVAQYQRHFTVPGPLLGAALLVCLLGIIAADRSPVRRAPLLLVGGVSVVLLTMPPLTAGFDYRYVPPVLPFLGPGTVFAVDLIRQRTLRRPVSTSVVDPVGPTRGGDDDRGDDVRTVTEPGHTVAGASRK